jgi:hypothetical protein
MSAPTGVGTTTPRDVPQRRPKLSGWQQWGAAAAGGCLTSLLVYLLLARSPVPPFLGPCTVVALVVLLPTARTLTGRIALNGSLLLGWTPVLWWVRWPVAVDQAALVVAVLAGVLVLVSLRRDLSPVPRGDRLPRLHRIDLLVLLAGLAAVLAVRAYLVVRTPRQSLYLLIGGYDNSAHFDMFLVARRHGATIVALGAAPDGSAWSYREYPQAYHSLLAMHAQLVQNHVGSPAQELVAYAHAMGAMTVFALVVLVAAVCSVPGLRSRPLVAAPVVGLVCTAYLVNPGAGLFVDGYANFLLSASAAATALVLAVAAAGQERAGVAASGAIAGLLMLTAHGWTPLAVVAAPAAWACLRGGVGPRGERGRRLVGWAILCVAGVGAVKAVLAVTSAVRFSQVVVATGAVRGAGPGPFFLVLGVSVLLSLRPVARRPRVVTVRYLAAAPLVGALLMAVLLASQIRSIGTTSYYFVKYVAGLELVLVPMTAVLVGLLVSGLRSPTRARLAPVLLSLGMVAASTQYFGHVSLSTAAQLSWERGRPSIRMDDPLRTRRAAGILSASSAPRSDQGLSWDYVALGSQRGVDATLPDAWFHALAWGITTGNAPRQLALVAAVRDAADAAPVVRRLLEGATGTSVIVGPGYAAALRAELPDLAGRVVTWPPAGSVQAEGER